MFASISNPESTDEVVSFFTRRRRRRSSRSKYDFYEIVTSQENLNAAETYLHNLQQQTTTPGCRLQSLLHDVDISTLTPLPFLEKIIQSKEVMLFAESPSCPPYWTKTEVSILGNVNIIVPVTIFDDGRHRQPLVYDSPFSGHLLFCPGALFRGPMKAADFDYCVEDYPEGPELNFERFYELYERRLVPLFLHADVIGDRVEKDILITIPGLGCGCFAGPFRGSLGSNLLEVIKRILSTHGARFRRLKAIHYDPYDECQDDDFETHGIHLQCRPLSLAPSANQTPQLSRPERFNPTFANYHLCSIVAWDHLSWPGNDFYALRRSTDDGVKAAATDSMRVMTGQEGRYERREELRLFQYNPPEGMACWRAIVEENGLKIEFVEQGRYAIYGVGDSEEE